MIAVANVIFSFQLRLGSASAYASYNHIMRDTAIILMWAMLSILLVSWSSDSSGSHSHQTSERSLSISITGSGLLMAQVTMDHGGNCPRP